MNTGTSIFKFATVRSPNPETTQHPELEIQPSTAFAKFLVTTLASGDSQADKISTINQALQSYLDSKSFFKTKAQLVSAIGNPNSSASARETGGQVGGGNTDVAALRAQYETLYDNILFRTVTKSTNSEVFKLLATNIKRLHQQLNANGVSIDQIKDLRIILPEGLVLAFSPPKPPPAPVVPPPDPAPVIAQIQALTEQKQLLQAARAANASKIAAEQNRVTQEQLEQAITQVKQVETARGKVTRSKKVALNSTTARVASPALDQLRTEAAQLQQTETQIDSQLGGLTLQTIQLLPITQLVPIGNAWVDRSTLTPTQPPITDGTIVVYTDGCDLKFPFQVADLRVVEQQTVGYVPGEIAHINNTQQGEFHEKVTRRLTRVETMESLTTEAETIHETDTQSTEKFTLEKAASEVQSEETSGHVNASVSTSYGPVKASLDAGYSSGESSQNSNTASQSYAKELVQKTVDRVSTRVTQQRSTKRTEEFEETVKHVIDNRTTDGPRSYVYRWLTKLTRATLKNYGKRLIFQIDVPHPSHQYLSGSIVKATTIKLPGDPRTLTAFFGLSFPDWIVRGNYGFIADWYKTKLEPPPEETILVNRVYAGETSRRVEGQVVPIPDGYAARDALLQLNMGGTGSASKWSFVTVMIGRMYQWGGVSATPNTFWLPLPLDYETGSIPISIAGPDSNPSSVTINLEITCELQPAGFRAWQMKCYQALIDAYDNLKAEADSTMSGFDPNAPGLNPDAKQALIMTELKKGALSKMFRCNAFWITDNYVVGTEYAPDCCTDSLKAERVRFLETLFDWDNVTYELYPYFYANKGDWPGLSRLTDDDPRFEAFLQASYATVRIPVHRDSLKETAAVNFITNNSIANYETVPAGMQPLLDELKKATPTIGLDGKPLPVALQIVDLGIFPVPTDLVILECGNAGGVKPKEFKDIPKEYQQSPTIIADRCPPSTRPAPTGG